MSRDRQDGRLLSLLALQVLLDYGRAGATRPPVTAALLAANTLLYLRPGNLDALLPRLPRVLFNPHLIIEFGDLRRFLFSVFFHTSEPQFVMNMSSLLWRGGRLEEYMGSFEFASMVASLIGLSQGFTLLLSKGLLLLGDGTAYYQYSSGFSGVLLGMQVLNARAGDIVLFGVCIPAKYAELAQLFLMQALIHEVNIVGNLSGILAGLTYLWLKNGPDPLSDIANVVSRSVRFARGIVRSAARRCQSCSGRRVFASVQREVGQGMWRCTTCSHDNSRSEDVCERCSIPHEDHAFSRRRHLQDVGNEELPVEEIRARRLQRFER